MIEVSYQYVKETQLGILKNVKLFCDEHKINYYLTGGTCIGAIRHKGYIPWDDDIDISMKREDYIKFIQEYVLWTKDFNLNSCETTKSYPYPFAKISDPNSILVEENDELKMEMGINIDLFPIDTLPDNKLLIQLVMSIIMFLRNAINLKAIKVNEERKIHKNTVLIISKFILRIFSSNVLSKFINSFASHRWNSKHEKGGIIVWGYGKREIVNIHCFDETIEVEFENDLYKVPKDFDTWLTSIYGNYMQLPPIEKQVTHHRYKAYIK